MAIKHVRIVNHCLDLIDLLRVYCERPAEKSL
jgi:hypothetical protein